jgi:fructose-bisphosphate aldolase class II
MPLQSIVPMLKKAQNEGYAVGLFDAHSYEGFTAILAAAVDQSSPVIIAPQVNPRGPGAALVRGLVADIAVPVAIELDHGRSFELAMECIRGGFTDVMIDASTLPYDGNVALTKQVVAAAHAVGMGVEAEIGHVGRGTAYGDVQARKATFTTPEDAVRFVSDTDVDVLAVAIGSAHGMYKGTPELDLERLRQIRAEVDVPLVLHGGSGLSDDDFRAAIADGIAKINIYTNMAMAAVAAMRVSLDDPDARYRQVQQAAEGAIKGVVEHCMQVFGSTGKA